MNTKINIKHLILGILLNILVIIACFLIYDAYRIKPNIPTSDYVVENMDTK